MLHMMDMFSLAWEEQVRTETLLDKALPLLKKQHLLLLSYDFSEDRRREFEVRQDK